MKILISAYACEPNKGSEPGVGWSWANELAKQHEVWVITRDNNKTNIEKYFAENPDLKKGNLHFVYVGLSKWLTFWKKGRRGMRPFYMMWQHKAVSVAKKIHNENRFDLVQHVTFVSYTQPTYMYKLKIPMIWGPIGGGENIPESLDMGFRLIEQFTEEIRKISQKLALVTPSTKKMLEKSKAILVTTEETKAKLPQKYWDKIRIMPAIGIESIPINHAIHRSTDKINIVMAGRLDHEKSLDIGIRAYIKALDIVPNMELHILGEGKKKQALEIIAGEHLGKDIYFLPPVQHDDIYDFYCGYDLLVNTSLRDSGCMTMMEAMSVGLPCIAIAAGGPNVLLNGTPECKVFPYSYNQCVNELAEMIVKLALNREARIDTGKRQEEYIVNNLTIHKKIEDIYELYG